MNIKELYIYDVIKLSHGRFVCKTTRTNLPMLSLYQGFDHDHAGGRDKQMQHGEGNRSDDARVDSQNEQGWQHMYVYISDIL